MYVTLVHIRVKPESVAAFIEATLANCRAAIGEAGNRRFDLLQSPDDSTRFVLYEAYDTAADAAAHKDTAHYLAWRAAVGEMMAEARQGQAMNGIFPN